jgi:hypothetical protein
MTLKEKLFDELLDDTYEFKKANILPRLVDILEEFAIDFAEWCIESEGKNYNKYKYRNRKELLEIYKQEKGL